MGKQSSSFGQFGDCFPDSSFGATKVSSHHPNFHFFYETQREVFILLLPFWYHFVSSLPINCCDRAKAMELDLSFCFKCPGHATETPTAWECRSQKKTTGLWWGCICSRRSGQAAVGGAWPRHLFRLLRRVRVWESELSHWVHQPKAGWEPAIQVVIINLLALVQKKKKKVTISHYLSRTENFTSLWKCMKCYIDPCMWEETGGGGESRAAWALVQGSDSFPFSSA